MGVPSPARAGLGAALCAAVVHCGPGVPALTRATPGAAPPITSLEPDTTCDPPTPGRLDAARIFAEMSDLQRLTRLPEVAYTEPMASSYDRRSLRPGNDEWFGNIDASGFVRSEGGENVMLDATGPGVVTRIWTAAPAGTIRIYLDGARTPVVEAAMSDLMEGRVEPFTAPFAYTSSRGRNLVYPIPFARGLKITTTASTLYYNIDYRRYPAGHAVTSFSAAPPDAREACHQSAAAATLRGAGPRPVGVDPVTLDTAQEFVLVAADGGSEVTVLTLRPPSLDDDVLRRTAVSMTFDGERTVFTPLGDLFAYQRGAADVRSLPVTATATELTLRFPMPFAREARLRLVDMGGGALRVPGAVTVRPRAFDDASLHFHARWTGPSTVSSLRPSDWPLARITGRGFYVGTSLRVANPDPAWWGEGDEKIFVDGEPFPSRFGTGTEDYFTYAFCDTTPFSNAYFGQTRANADDFAGFVALYRFHVVDAIPFTRALRFDLEALHWQAGMRDVPVQYEAVYYFYARPGARTEERPVGPMDFQPPSLPAGVAQPAVPPGGAGYHC